MFAWQATVQDERGNAIPEPVVAVYESDGETLAAIYNEAGDALDNPLTGTPEGFVQFWAEAGRYVVEGGDGSTVSEKWHVALGDETECKDAADFFSRGRLTIGLRYWSKDGLAWDIVPVGSGDFDHPVTGQGVIVVPVDGMYPFDAFGAVGDGVTDDYAIFQRVAAFAKDRKGFGLRFGHGKTYFIKKIIGVDAGVDNIIWTNIEFLHIDLNGSTIRSNGDYHRDVSTKRQVMPFYTLNCKYMHIHDGEVDGGIYDTTRESAIAEIRCHGIYVPSEMVLLENLYVHHWLADGIYYGGTGNANTSYYSPCHITMINVRSLNNARQGLSVTMGSMLYALNCEFKFSGFTAKEGGENEGGYTRHQPAAGVDIEPDISNTRAIDNGFIGFYRFESCIFAGNHNYQFLCAHSGTMISLFLNTS